jgi:hypothetical protein
MANVEHHIRELAKATGSQGQTRHLAPNSPQTGREMAKAIHNRQKLAPRQALRNGLIAASGTAIR